MDQIQINFNPDQLLVLNICLALILIFNFFDGLGGMALIAAWWGIWHLISAFGLIVWWQGRPAVFKTTA